MMTISSYQIDNILKAYSKQNKVKIGASFQPDMTTGAKYADVVTLAAGDKTAAYDKISYSLMDILLKSKKNND
jgi:ABC-type enterochelin transport system substrate-binding protein